MKIEFIALNKGNWEDCAKLWNSEDRYVTPNLRSIAEAQFYAKAISRAIFNGKQMIGYAMYGEDEDDAEAWAIDRFMISSQHRRKGYGSEALRSIIDTGRTRGFRKFITSTAVKNKAMQSLLSKVGFTTKHEIREGEHLYYFQEENLAQQGTSDNADKLRV